MQDRPVVEFDHHNKEFHDNRHAEWAELRSCPVAFNPRFGGFWVVSGYEEVESVARDGETFSSLYVSESDDGIDYLGISGMPRAKTTQSLGIGEVEGPLHTTLRRAINPFLSPLAIAALEPLMSRVAAWFLDQVIETGHIDLVADLTNPVPAILTMEAVGLPLDGWRRYADLFHCVVAYRPGHPEFDQAIAHVPAMLADLNAEAASRREAPRDDLFTALVELRVGGELALTDAEVGRVLWNLVGGGLDTTTSLTSLVLHHLDQHPDLRHQLIDHPELVPSATEEFLRFFSVNETLTRTVTRDVELGGQQLRRGDHVMLSWLSADRDETKFECPDQVILDRAPNPHLALGIGPHRCIGMHMARTMFQVLLREVLTRIPDYEIDRSAVRFYEENPQLNGVMAMPARFSPGIVTGPTERPF